MSCAQCHRGGRLVLPLEPFYTGVSESVLPLELFDDRVSEVSDEVWCGVTCHLNHFIANEKSFK